LPAKVQPDSACLFYSTWRLSRNRYEKRYGNAPARLILRNDGVTLVCYAGREGAWSV